MTDITQRLLADIRIIAPEITARAAEFEAARRIPLDMVETLKSIGALRLLVPRSHGGLELDFPAASKIIRALSRLDGSVGWTTAIASGAAVFTSFLPRETYDAIYRSGPNVPIAGSGQPAGTAEAVPGGYRVTGRWPFASGCLHAAFMGGLCIVTENGKPLPGPPGMKGMPLIKGFFLPATEWQIEDTWYVAGLKGTGSHHISIKDKLVPEENFFDLAQGKPCIPGPLYQALEPLLPLLHGSVTVGIAEGAVDELVALANTGRQQTQATQPLRETELFQSELGRIAADMRAAGAFLDAAVAAYWSHAQAGTLKDEARYVESRQAAIWLAGTATRVADACFAIGGGSTLYDASPLQRRLRDLHTAGQHASAQPRHYVAAGKLLLERSVVSEKSAAA
jgi:alkylation response protein AidB-like acyl-CoA dehydrogenase